MPNLTLYLYANYNRNFWHPTDLFWSSLKTWTGLYTVEFQACQLSQFYHESHDFSASLTVSWPHKLISWAVHFAMWISTDARLILHSGVHSGIKCFCVHMVLFSIQSPHWSPCVAMFAWLTTTGVEIQGILYFECVLTVVARSMLGNYLAPVEWISFAYKAQKSTEVLNPRCVVLTPSHRT